MKRRLRTLSDEIFELFDEHQVPIKYVYDIDTLVDFSFLVHRSISYLNLEVGIFSNFKKKTERPDIDNLYKEPSRKCFRYDYFYDLRELYTEEACKKLYAPFRQVLYVFHLDVSKKLDLNLRTADIRKVGSCSSDNVFLNMVLVREEEVYEFNLNKIITEAITESNQKAKLISNVSKLLRRFRFLSDNRYMQNEGLNILCSEGADIRVLKEFLSATFRFEDCLHFDTSAEAYKLFLHHANVAGYDLWSSLYPADPIHTFIKSGNFEKGDSVFEYLDAPKFDPELFYRWRGSKSWLESDHAFQRLAATGPMTQERCLLILEIMWIHSICRCRGLQTLQKLWRSIPDSFVTVDELALASSRQLGTPTPEEIDEICSYVKEINGEDVLEGRRRQPRKLKHYCRVSIRRVLSNNRKLSTGIETLKLPPALKSYLRLEN